MSNVITARVSDEVLAMIDQLATTRERSRAWITAKLIEEAARRQSEFDAFLQVGLDDLAAGRVHTQEDVEAWFTERKANRATRIAVE
jgi:predicted transcriptional regulator